MQIVKLVKSRNINVHKTLESVICRNATSMKCVAFCLQYQHTHSERASLHYVRDTQCSPITECLLRTNASSSCNIPVSEAELKSKYQTVKKPEVKESTRKYLHVLLRHEIELYEFMKERFRRLLDLVQVMRKNFGLE